MEEKFKALRARLGEVEDIQAAASVLGWDQSTYMPAGGGEARGRQLATLSRLAHERFTDDAVGQLLDDLKGYDGGNGEDGFEARLIRVARHDYDRAVRVPSSLMAELAQHSANGFDIWAAARPANDFAAVIPVLERSVELAQRLSSYFPEAAHVADPLIDEADAGMTVATIQPLFAELRAALVPLVEAIVAQPPADTSILHRHYPEADQWAFGEEVIRQLGYDFTRGRQDKAPHPFMTRFSVNDVRITTRFREDDITDGLFSTIHEAGHAMYEQGVSPTLEGTPLGFGTSAGVHESQSRLWENMVGRSRGFWAHFYPKLQARFPGQLGGVPMEAFYRAINHVQPSLIRTDADEVTYNLHVLIRFDLELALLEGKLAVKELPDAWHARYESDLGVRAPDDRDGVLQDIHWHAGIVGGAFQGYTLGNILAAQLFAKAKEAHPAIPDEIERGEFATLLGWLREKVYAPGRSEFAPELIERVTGGPLRLDPYLEYLRGKYGELYGVA